MRKSLLALTLVITAAASCYAKERPLGGSEKTAIISSLESMLKDPDSAKFKWPPVNTENNFKDGYVAYCFKVNAKNSYGGYTGYKIVHGRAHRPGNKIVGFEYIEGLSPIAASEEVEQEGVAKICAALGVHLD